jgi:hypothetical protein
MRSPVKFLTVAALLGVAIVIGIALGWFGTPSPTAERPVSVNPPTPSSGQDGDPIVTAPSGSTNRQAVKPIVGLATNQTPAAVMATNLITDWEDRLDSILGSEGEERDKAKQLLQMFQRLPIDGQVEVAGHLSNLVEDQDYEPLRKLLVDPTVSEEVLDVLIADILNRPNALKLPALLEVARNTQHPKSGEAKDVLELYLEEDYGPDWTKWQAGVDVWLKANPD